MKIIIAFGFFLVAGILNSDLAQAEDAKKPAAKQTYVDLLGKVKVNPFSDDDSEEIVEELIKAKCNRNGGPTAYDTAVQGLEDLENSFVAAKNATENSIESDDSDDSSSEDIDEFRAICRGILTLKDSVIKAVDAFKPCLDLKERQTVELLVNISFPVIEYVCENDGSNLLGFYETGGVECLEATYQSAHACNDNITAPDSTESIDATTSSDSYARLPRPFDLPEITIDLEYCTKYEAVQNCVVGQLNECPKRTPSNFVNSMYNIVKRESGCKAILKAHADEDSAPSSTFYTRLG